MSLLSNKQNHNGQLSEYDGHSLSLASYLKFYYYSKAKTSWHLWAEHEAPYTIPNFHLRAVFFAMESNISYNLESKSIKFVL